MSTSRVRPGDSTEAAAKLRRQAEVAAARRDLTGAAWYDAEAWAMEERLHSEQCQECGVQCAPLRDGLCQTCDERRVERQVAAVGA